MADDLIDFPCSDSWRDYYAERGLTAPRSPRAAPSWKTTRQAILAQTAEREPVPAAVRETLRRMRREIDRLRVELDAARATARSRGAPEPYGGIAEGPVPDPDRPA